MEVFKTIASAPRFEINQLGEVRNKETLNLLNHTTNYGGYPCVTLALSKGRGSKTRKALIHVELAKAFIENPNPEKFDQVLHLDDNRANFSLDNLKWGDQKMNMKQSSDTGFYNTVKKELDLISPAGEVIHIRGLRTFCSDNNLDWGNFSKMVKGINRTCKGWKLHGNNNGCDSRVSH